MTTGFLKASILAASALAGAATAPGLAAGAARPDPAPGRAAVVQALSDCRRIAEDAARLACYDKAAGDFDQAEQKGDVVVVDQEKVKAVRRQAFGFRLPTLNIFSRGAGRNDEGVDHLSLQIDSVHHNAEGKWVFVGDDGAVWRQTDTSDLVRDPHKGSVMLITKGVLGSFFCKVDGQSDIRCQRVS